MDFMQNSAVLAVNLSAGRLIGDLFIALFLYCAHDSGHDVGLGRLFQIDRAYKASSISLPKLMTP